MACAAARQDAELAAAATEQLCLHGLFDPGQGPGAVAKWWARLWSVLGEMAGGAGVEGEGARVVGVGLLVRSARS